MSHGRIAFLLVLLLGAGVVLDQLLRFGLAELRRWRRRRRVFSKPHTAHPETTRLLDKTRREELTNLVPTTQLRWPPWPRDDPVSLQTRAFEDAKTTELAPHFRDDFFEEAPTEPRLRATGSE